MVNDVNLMAEYWIFSWTNAEQIALIIVFVACIFWITEWIPLYVTSFFILFLELIWLLPELQTIASEVKPEVFLSPFFSDTVLLFLGGFTISAALHKFRLDFLLANWILSWNRSSLTRLLLAVTLISSFLSFWLNNTATAAMMLGIIFPLVEKFPIDSGWRKAFILSVPFATNIGGIGTPVGTLPNALAIEYLRQSGFAFGFLEWLMVFFPIVILLDCFMVFLLKFIFCRNEKVHPYHIHSEIEIVLLNGKSIYVVITIFLTIIGWLTSSIHQISNGTIALIPVVLFFGFGVLNRNDFRNLPWDILILLGGGISMGKGIEISGLTKRVLLLIPHTDASILGILAIFCLITIVMSSIMSNTATANLMIPIAMILPYEKFPLVVILTAVSASLAMPLPVSTPPNSIAFGYGILKSRELILPGTILTIVGYISLIALGYFLLTINLIPGRS